MPGAQPNVSATLALDLARRPLLGVSAENLSQADRDANHLVADQGVSVQRIVTGSAAERAGIEYMRQVATQNLPGLWSPLDLSLLAIYGSANFVTSEEDTRAIVDAVNRAHPGRCDGRHG
jgi:S1-C subfamily serine protease